VTGVRPRGKHRDHLLDVGLRLFRERGFAATGVAEIAQAAGVPKGSFYNYFPSKEAFALEVLERYREAACQRVRASLSTPALSPLERVRRAFSDQEIDLAAEHWSGSCLAGRLAQELAGEHPCFREPLDRTFVCIATELAGVLREAQAAGELDPGEDVEGLAGFLVTAWQGTLMRAKSVGGDEPIRRFHELALGRLLAPRTIRN
jgi:TetR/AcrR family transcriptional repressor of nem operon